MIKFVRHTAQQQLPSSSPEAQTELLALLRTAVAGDGFAVNLSFVDSLIDAGQQAGDVGVEHEVGEQTATPGVNWIVEQLEQFAFGDNHFSFVTGQADCVGLKKRE